jgi:hypothetical protein
MAPRALRIKEFAVFVFLSEAGIGGVKADLYSVPVRRRLPVVSCHRCRLFSCLCGSSGPGERYERTGRSVRHHRHVAGRAARGRPTKEAGGQLPAGRP